MNPDSSAPSSAGSSMTGPAVFETERNLAHLVFDLDGHSATTQKRLYSASNFILEHGFDDLLHPELDYLMESHMNIYLREGEEGRRNFLGAKLMASNMIHLEDIIIRSHPDRDYDNLSDEALNTIIREHLRQKEVDELQKKDPIFPKGTGLSRHFVSQVLEAKSYANEPNISDSHNCLICMEDFKKNKCISTLKHCGHVYHTVCIMKWLYDHRLCPLCKKLVLPIIAEYPPWVNDMNIVRDFLKRV